MAESTGRNALADCIQRVQIEGQTDLIFNIECFTDDSGTTFYGVWELVDNTLVLNFYTVDAGGNLTPYNPTSTPVPCSPTDIEETQNCWIALADGVGYSTDDQIQQTHFWDTSAIPPTLLATTWYNQTTRQVIAAPPPQTDLGPCDESSDCHILCDTIPPLGDPIVVDAYPGVDGQTGNWQIANGGFTVDYDVTAPSESADILTGSDGGIAVRNSGVPNDGPVVVTVPATGIDTWSIDIFDLDVAPAFERVMFDIAPIAFTNALQIDPFTFEGVGDGLLSQFTFPSTVTTVTVTRPDLQGGQYVLEQVTINPPSEDEETVVLFRRCFNTTPPTDTDLDGNAYITQGEVGLCGSKSVVAGCYEDENGNFFDAIVLLNDNGTISSVVINNVVTDVTVGNLVVGRQCEACCVPSGESETFQHVDLPHAEIATDAGFTAGTTQYNGNLCGDNIKLVPFDLTVVALEVTTSTEPIFTWSGVANGGPHEIVLSSSGTLRMGFASCDGGMNETIEFIAKKPDRIFPGTGSTIPDQATLDGLVLPITWHNGNSSDATYFEWDNVTVVPFTVNSQDTITMRGFVDAVTFDNASRWSVDDCCCGNDNDCDVIDREIWHIDIDCTLPPNSADGGWEFSNNAGATWAPYNNQTLTQVAGPAGTQRVRLLDFTAECTGILTMTVSGDKTDGFIDDPGQLFLNGVFIGDTGATGVIVQIQIPLIQGQINTLEWWHGEANAGGNSSPVFTWSGGPETGCRNLVRVVDCDGEFEWQEIDGTQYIPDGTEILGQCASAAGSCCDEDAVYQHKVFDIINSATWTPADLPVGVELIEFSFSVIINAADNGVINSDATPAGNLPVGYSVHGRVLEGGVIEPPQIIDSGTAGRILVDATWRVP